MRCPLKAAHNKSPKLHIACFYAILMRMAQQRFHFFKVSVEDSATEQSTVINRLTDKGEILKALFHADKPIEFTHRKNQKLAYVIKCVVGDYIVASLGKKSEVNLSGPPETGFESKKQEEWPNVLLIINTSKEQPFGQTIAVQLNASVFEYPEFPIKSLVVELQKRSGLECVFDYEFIVHGVKNESSFWDIVKKKSGKISKLTFDLATPNFLNLNDELSESLKQVRRDYNATSIETTLKNNNGGIFVPRSSQLINELVNYSNNGAGEIKIQTIDDGRISTTEYKTSTTIEQNEMRVVVEGNDLDKIKEICDSIYSCLS